MTDNTKRAGRFGQAAAAPSKTNPKRLTRGEKKTQASAFAAANGRPHPEMLQKPHPHEAFFTLKHAPEQRPLSVATEFMESDFDDDEILSDVDDGESSPRLSLNSVSVAAP
jgi:hypothetical protein